MFNEEVVGKVALKEKKLLGLNFLTIIPIALEDGDDKPLAIEKFETKEVATPMVNTWKSWYKRLPKWWCGYGTCSSSNRNRFRITS